MDAADLKRLKAAGMVREGRTVGEALKCSHCWGTKKVVVASVYGHPTEWGPCPRCTEQEAAPRVGEVVYVLPWPPSVNEYLRFGILPAGKGKRPYLTPGGKLCDGYIKPFHTQKSADFRKAAIAAIGYVTPIRGDVEAEVIAYPPSRHRRDLDNLLKCTLDALQHAGALLDDTQIRRLSISWGPRKPGGAIEVRLTPIPEAKPDLFEGR